MVDAVGTTHAVKIGTDHFMLRPGTYRKRPAPTFGARFTTGDPDYNNLSAWQHWAQTCWVGGFGAETWMDDAMFDEGVGVDTSQHEVMVLSRDMGPTGSARATQNWDLNLEPNIRIFTVFNNKLYALQVGSSTTSRLYVFTGTAWTLLKTFVEEVRWMEPFGGYLVFGDTGSTLNRMNTAETFSTFAKPSGKTGQVYSIKAFRGKLYVCIMNEIWRLKSDFTWDGSTAFFVAEDVTYINLADVHLGFLYFGSRNGHILRTDGNNTFDLWAFEPHVVLWGIRSFDGRLFIGAAEEIEGTNAYQTVLYQFSGAAVTELKRWGKVGYDTTPGKLRAFESSLFFGASNLLGMGSRDGFGIARYDPREDAYHLFTSNQDDVSYPPGTEGVLTTVDDVMYFKGYLYASVRGYGIFRTAWTYKDVTRFQATYDTTTTGVASGSKNGGWYESSDFDAGTPGLLKMWNAMTIHVDLPTSACSVYAEFSIDGGQTWNPAGGSTAAATVSKTGSDTRYAKQIMLEDIAGSGTSLKSTRLKYRLTLRTTDSGRSPQLRGVIVRYLPIPEPNWMWDMTLVLSDKQELLDKTIQAPVNSTKLANLRAAFRTQEPVAFTEPGGTQYAVGGEKGAIIYNYEELIPHIGPTSEGQLEYEIRITLMETTEAYE